MNAKKSKKLRKELKEKLGRPPAKPQYNIRGEVVEQSEWREYKKQHEK